MQGIDIVFSIVILIMSVVVHEVSHGYAAEFLGDPTARLSGRLTLNPIKHLDPIGSVLVPIITSFAGFTFGWAKPVPFNPYNLRSRRWGELIVASAGPISNILVALAFAVIIRLAVAYGTAPVSFILICGNVVAVNIVLAIFNLVPIPPLDGSKILFAFLPYHMLHIRQALERYSFFFVLIFVFFVWQLLFPIIGWLFFLLTGIPLG